MARSLKSKRLGRERQNLNEILPKPLPPFGQEPMGTPKFGQESNEQVQQ